MKEKIKNKAVATLIYLVIFAGPIFLVMCIMASVSGFVPSSEEAANTFAGLLLIGGFGTFCTMKYVLYVVGEKVGHMGCLEWVTAQDLKKGSLIALEEEYLEVLSIKKNDTKVTGKYEGLDGVHEFMFKNEDKLQVIKACS